MKKALVKTALLLVDFSLRINIRIIPFREIPLGIQLKTSIEKSLLLSGNDRQVEEN